MLRFFLPSAVISLVILIAVFLWGGVTALIFALLLSILEVTLSFDNAVVNAKVLAKMSAVWQRRFLTWGILFAVFGTRVLLPLLIVSAAVWLSPLFVLQLVFSDPHAYSAMLESISPIISAFGGAFLLMVALKYFFDEAKSVHWIQIIERHLARWGRIEAIEIMLVLIVLLAFYYAIPDVGSDILSAGILGLILFIGIEGIANSFRVEAREAITHGGLILFLYLNVLDAAFSLDSVIGAFALSTQLPVIVAGLGIGALFVRTLTVYLVRRKTLETLVYIEHGAHWAILGLACVMFASLIVHVSELIIGLIGLIFIVLAYRSSIKKLRASALS